MLVLVLFINFLLIECYVVSDDLDGVPMYASSSSPSVRPKQVVKAATSKWETEAPVLASSKWDNPDLESDPYEATPSSNRKKSRGFEDIFTDAADTDAKVSDDELDGVPLADDSSQEAAHHNSDSKLVSQHFVDFNDSYHYDAVNSLLH